jgi:hypothetical protein
MVVRVVENDHQRIIKCTGERVRPRDTPFCLLCPDNFNPEWSIIVWILLLEWMKISFCVPHTHIHTSTSTLSLQFHPQEKRAERAVGGSLHPSAPRGSLFALELKAQRQITDDLRGVDNRFPFQDGYVLKHMHKTHPPLEAL